MVDVFKHMANCSTTGRWIYLPGEWDVNRWNDKFNYLSLTGRLFHYSGQLHIFALRLKNILDIKEPLILLIVHNRGHYVPMDIPLFTISVVKLP